MLISRGAPNPDSEEHLWLHNLLFRNLACERSKFMDCDLHEQIVILFPSCKVLSKEERSRLKE